MYLSGIDCLRILINEPENFLHPVSASRGRAFYDGFLSRETVLKRGLASCDIDIMEKFTEFLVFRNRLPSSSLNVCLFQIARYLNKNQKETFSFLAKEYDEFLKEPPIFPPSPTSPSSKEFVCDLMPFLHMLEEKPGFFIQSPSLEYLAPFLDGLMYGLSNYIEEVSSIIDLHVFARWLAKTLSTPQGLRWDESVLLVSEGDDKLAFKKFFQLFATWREEDSEKNQSR